MGLESHILLRVYAFSVFHKTQKNAQKIELYAGRFKGGQLLLFMRLARTQDALEHIKEYVFGAQPDGIAILLLNSVSVAVESLVEIVGLFEYRYIKVVHSMKLYKDVFNRIIAAENLFRAWDVFKSEKLKKSDVQLFERNLEENIFKLHRELKNKTYEHGPYKGFFITDPKQRHIHKALVRDRVLHHAIFSVINPIFEPTFISTSYSCRIGHGTHRGVEKLAVMMRSISRNGTRPCFILKCDIKKFFDSVNHAVLLEILKKRIKDQRAIWLLERIITSFGPDKRERERERETKDPARNVGYRSGTSRPSFSPISI